MKDLNDPTNVDTVPAMLTEGEFVLNKEATAMYGPLIEQMNEAGLAQRAAENGQVVKANTGSYIGYNVGGLVSFLKKEEGYRDEAYPDSGGVWTIGYGRTQNPDGSPVKKGQKTNRKAEDTWLDQRAQQDYDATKSYLDANGYDYSEGQLNSLASFRYNGGQGMLESLTGNGTRDWDTIKTKMPQYNKVTVDGKKVPIKGLSNRREAELSLWGGQDKAPPARPTEGVPAVEEVPPTQDAGFQSAISNALSQAMQPRQITHAPMVQSMAPQQPQYIPSVTEKKMPGTFNQGGPVHLNNGGWWNTLFGKEEKKQNEIVAFDPYQGTVTYANGVTQVDPNKAQIMAMQAGPAQPQQQYQPSPIQPQGPGFEPTQPGMKGGGVLNVPGLQEVPPNVQPQAPAQKGPTVRDQLSGSLRRSWDERRARENNNDTPPVPGSDEAILQGSSQQVEQAEAAQAPQLPTAPPMPPTDLSGMSPEQIGKLYDEGNPAAVAYAENEENQWRVGEELNQSRLNQAVQGDDPTIQSFNQQKTDELQRQLAGLQGTPEGAQVAQNEEGAQLSVPSANVPQLPQDQVAGALPQEATPGQLNLPTNLEGPTFEPEDAREKAIASPPKKPSDAERAPKVKQAVDNAAKAEPPMANQPEGDQLVQAGLKAGKPAVVAASGKLKEAFGDLFDTKELARMAVVFAGAMATGASAGQALAISGQMYLSRVDAKQATQQKYMNDLATGGKYTPASLQAYKESGDLGMLMPTSQGGVAGTGQYQDFYGPGGKITAEKVKVGKDQYKWVGPNGQVVDGRRFNQDPSNVRGTPEYRTRINSSTKQVEGVLDGLRSTFDKQGTGDETFYKTDVVPAAQAGKIAEWAASNNVAPEEMAGLVESAYHNAINDKRQDGARVRDLTPYLNQLVIRQSVGASSEVFRTNPGADGPPQYLDTEKMTVMNRVASDLLKSKGFKGGSQDLANQFYTAAISDWNKLPAGVKKDWERKANKGENGFYHFAQDYLVKTAAK